ncbi:MAG: DUF3365 domain-containing protein [Gemmataceae bacterium]
MILRTLALVLILTGSTFVGGCGQDERRAKGWQAVRSGHLSANQAVQKKKALAARDAMFGQLMKRLQAVLKDGGPAAAIGVCQKEAPNIAKAVAKEHGLKIGRTSFKLRNPKNQPPSWANNLVKQKSQQLVYLSHPDGRFAAFLPIHLQNKCLICHGEKDQISEDVRETLAKLYPEDAATGFSEGDLRGWFWVEVPAMTE